MASTTPLPRPVASLVIVERSRGMVSLRLKELWRYRELVYFMVWRDIRVRYAQAVIGVGWALLVPLFQMVVFSVFFGRVAKVPSDGLPYPIFAYTALVPWSFFANGLAQSSNSIVGSAHLITKVSLSAARDPHRGRPLGRARLRDRLRALVIAIMIYYGTTPTAHVVWLPLFWVLALVTSLGAGLWLAARTNDRVMRDVRHMYYRSSRSSGFARHR